MMDQILLQQRHPDYVELIQFTDTHIFADPNETFDAVDTARTLYEVMEHARATCWPPDAILLTGDLVHDPVAAAYDRLAGILQDLREPVFCLPGNHDDPDLMQRLLPRENISMVKAVVTEQWLILMLDSFLPGTHAGCLHEDELRFITEKLNEFPGKYVLICLHHPPVSIGSPWMDNMALQNPAALFAISNRQPWVKGVLWGHIHQEFQALRGGLLLMATPSTCVQFKPRTDRYIKDNLAPGYRQIRLYAAGMIDTRVIRASACG